MKEIFVLIPAYNPDNRLNQLIEYLKMYVQNIIVVNDGSNNNFDFDGLSVKTLTHPINLGKGAALKTGFKYIIDNFSDCKGVVTADCDLQHSIEDIMKIFNALEANPSSLHLGCRNFSKTNTPLRSFIGNILMSKFMKLIHNMNLSDTQTGLRGIPANFIKHIIKIKVSDFSFETLMLIEAVKCKIQIVETPIETIYINNNSHSHFNPIIDSCKIIKTLIRTNND